MTSISIKGAQFTSEQKKKKKTLSKSANKSSKQIDEIWEKSLKEQHPAYLLKKRIYNQVCQKVFKCHSFRNCIFNCEIKKKTQI